MSSHLGSLICAAVMACVVALASRPLRCGAFSAVMVEKGRFQCAGSHRLMG